MGVMSKHLASDSIGFHPMRVAYTKFMFVNLFMLISSIIYWVYFEFDYYLFKIGLFGSIFDAVGIACYAKANSSGPRGLVAALGTTNNLLLVIFEAIKH